MTKRTKLEEQINAHRIEHVRFKELFDTIVDRIDDALNGSEAKFQAIAGPSRVGKSAIIKALKQRYPETKQNHERRAAVFFVNSIDAPSPTVLPRSVLNAMGIPIPRSKRSVGDLTNFMHEQLDLVGNVVLVFDELSQVVERGSRVTPEEAARWCKTVILRGRTVIGAGVPRIERLLDADVQLLGRSYRTLNFSPYRPDKPEDLSAYISIGLAYLTLFDEHGWKLPEEHRQAVLANLYLHSPGLGGGIRDLMYQLARQLHGSNPRPLTLEDFAAASSALEPLGPRSPAPFTGRDVTLTDLNQAYLHVRSKNAPPSRAKG